MSAILFFRTSLHLFVDVILASFVLPAKVTGFGHCLFNTLDLGYVFYRKCAKKNSRFRFLAADLWCMRAKKWKLKKENKNPPRSFSQR